MWGKTWLEHIQIMVLRKISVITLILISDPLVIPNTNSMMRDQGLMQAKDMSVLRKTSIREEAIFFPCKNSWHKFSSLLFLFSHLIVCLKQHFVFVARIPRPFEIIMSRHFSRFKLHLWSPSEKDGSLYCMDFTVTPWLHPLKSIRNLKSSLIS